MLKFDFDEVSEYDHHLMGLNRRGSSDNQVLDFIDNHFDKYKADLEFAIVETTSIGHLGSIGETHIFGDYTNVGFKQIRDNYHELIDFMGEKYGSSPADYPNWYQRDSSFICINNTLEKEEAKHPHWFQDHDHAKKEKAHKELNVPEEERLNFLGYLSDYAKELTSRFQLDKFPHFCILVKPISLKRTDTAKTTYLAVGNFYLAFAAKTHKNKEFYLDLINLLCYVWMSCNWQELVSKLSGLAAEPEENIMPRIPKNLLKAFQTKNLHNSNSLETLYKSYFKSPDANTKVAERYQQVIKLGFEYLTGNYKNGDHMAPELEPLIKNGGKNALKKPDYKEVFLGILGSRVFCMVAMHVFGVSLEKLNDMLMLGNYGNRDDRSEKAIYNYFHDQRWLPTRSSDRLKHENNQKSIREYMLSTFSIFDIKAMFIGVETEMRKLPEKSDYIATCAKFKQELLNNLSDSDRKILECLPEPHPEKS